MAGIEGIDILNVMAGLVPAIPITKVQCPDDRDHRDKPGDVKLRGTGRCHNIHVVVPANGSGFAGPMTGTTWKKIARDESLTA